MLARERSLTFRPRHRLTHAREFQAVYAARCRKSAGPLTVFAMPNALPEPRLGLSVSRRVGKGHVRVAAKRAVREAFRHAQHELPAWETGRDGSPRSGRYDYVVQVRPHDPIPAAQYQRLLLELAEACHGVWAKRIARGELPSQSTAQQSGDARAGS